MESNNNDSEEKQDSTPPLRNDRAKSVTFDEQTTFHEDLEAPLKERAAIGTGRNRRTSQGLVLVEQCIEGLNSEEFRRGVNVSLTQQISDIEHLNPPLSYRERRRDEMLETIANSKWILYANILVLFLVVAVGALWFFFLLGWQTLCTPARNCEPRNTVFNVSIHVMTGLFTYMSSIVMPWRWAHTLHTLGWSRPHRSNAVGHDLYGLDTDDPWFHVPCKKRLVVLFFLQMNCFFQYANQVCRGIYHSYEDSETWPGNFWTSVFFTLSLVWALIGALLFWKHTSIVRETDKERFGPGPIEMIKDLWDKYRQSKDEAKKQTGEAEDGSDALGQTAADSSQDAGNSATNTEHRPNGDSADEEAERPGDDDGKGNAITPNAVHSSGDAENSSTQQEHEANDAAAIEQEGELPGDDDGNNNAHLSNGNDS